MMPLKILAGALVLVCAVPALVHLHGHDCPGAHMLAWTGLSAPGGKDQDAPSGTWMLEGGEMKIAFSGKDTLKIHPHGDNPVITIICTYTADKKGLVKARVSDYEGKDEVKAKVKEHLPLGSEFSFQWTAKGTTATLDQVKGKGDHVDLLKSRLEGKYEQK